MNQDNPVPGDLTLRYKWCEGSVPPPDHYEYSIEISPDGGKIEFCPDYPAEGVPVWGEEFQVVAGELESLHKLLITERMFRERWTEIENPPVGGSLEWLEIMAQDAHFCVPSTIEEAETAREVYAAIRALVPDGVWAGLMERYERYQERSEE